VKTAAAGLAVVVDVMTAAVAMTVVVGVTTVVGVMTAEATHVDAEIHLAGMTPAIVVVGEAAIHAVIVVALHAVIVVALRGAGAAPGAIVEEGAAETILPEGDELDAKRGVYAQECHLDYVTINLYSSGCLAPMFGRPENDRLNC